ncbi:Endogenous retrovirus group K member 8 Gag polyprotein [Bienertia sinuspersici]
MGGFVEYDESDPLGLDNFIKMKLLIDIDKPHRRGLRISINPTTSKWVDIKYERSGDFCYYCGRLGHVDRNCDNINEVNDNANEIVYRYGPWMRASPLKRNKMPKEETLKERMLLDKLKNKKVENPNKVGEANVTKLGPPSLARRAVFKETKKDREENVSMRKQALADENKDGECAGAVLGLHTALDGSESDEENGNDQYRVMKRTTSGRIRATKIS